MFFFHLGRRDCSIPRLVVVPRSMCSLPFLEFRRTESLQYIAPLLGSFNIVCLAVRNSDWVSFIFGGAEGNEGMGLLGFGLDWASKLTKAISGRSFNRSYRYWKFSILPTSVNPNIQYVLNEYFQWIYFLSRFSLCGLGNELSHLAACFCS